MGSLEFSIKCAEAELARLKALAKEQPWTFESWLADNTDARYGDGILVWMSVPERTYPECRGCTGHVIRLAGWYAAERPFLSYDERPVVMRGSRAGMRFLLGGLGYRSNSFFAKKLFWRIVRRDRLTIFTHGEWLPYAEKVWSKVCARLEKQGFRNFNRTEVLGCESGHLGLDCSNENFSYLLNGRKRSLLPFYTENCVEVAQERAKMMLQIHAVGKKLSRLPA